MPKFIIERTIPGAGSLSRDELQDASVNSNGVLERLGPEIQWVQSYVTDDKITCVYIAPDEAMVREHARQAGLPADAVMELRTVIDPTTAEPVRAVAAGGNALRSLAWLALAGVLSLGTTACDRPSPSEVEPMMEASASATTPAFASSDVAADLAALRGMTAPFHSIEAAKAAGWTVLIPHCRDNQPEGGMGWHYANPAYVDGEVEVLEPEALIYEPQRNGSLRLVGVEYAVPFSILPPEAEPPMLFGQSFQHNFGDELWMLHVWAWRENPNGMFATWNPKVSCAYAS